MRTINLLVTLVVIVLFSCKAGKITGSKDENFSKTQEPKQIVDGVMTKDQQAALTPDAALQDLINGNKRFVSGTTIKRNFTQQVRKSSSGQYPKAIVLSCIDSRVPVEKIFDQGLGDIFVARVAGNYLDEDLLGSIEFACKISGAKLILVLGHEQCGAIKGAIDDLKMGNLTFVLNKIKPAVTMSRDFAGEKTSKDTGYVKYVAENNVKYSMQQIREKSPIIKEMEDKGEIKIAGAYYRLTDGTLEFVK